MKYIAYNRDTNSYTKPIRMPQSSHCMYHGRFIPLSTFKECLHFKSVFLTFANIPFTRFHNLIFIQVSLDKLTSQYLTSRYKILWSVTMHARLALLPGASYYKYCDYGIAGKLYL